MNRNKQMTVAITALAFVTLCSSLIIIDASDASADSVLELTSARSAEQIAAIAEGEYDEVVFASNFTMESLLSIPDGTKVTAGIVNENDNQGYVVLSVKNDDESLGVLGSYTTLTNAANAFKNYRTTNDLSLIITLAKDSYTCSGEAHPVFVCSQLDVQGNNTTLVRSISDKTGEYDFAVDDTEFPSDVTMNFSKIKNFKIWGSRVSNTNLTVNIIDCDSSTEANVSNNSFVMLRDGDYQGTAKTILYIEGCTIDGNKLSDSAIHTTTAADVTIYNCSFSNSNVPINFNFKSTAYESSVKISDCTFTDCGSSTVSNDLESYSAPIRIVDSKNHDGTTSVVVAACTFTYSEGHSSANGDILIGDGRSGKNSNSMDLSVYNTDADIQIQKPGYYNASFEVENVESCRSHTSTTTDAIVLQGDSTPSTFVPTVTINVGNTIVMTIPENGTIYYTLDGSTPTLGGSVYTRPIPVTGSWTVKAVYISDSGYVSQVSTAMTNYSPGSNVDEDDELPFIPGNNTPSQSTSDSDKTTLVAVAAAVVVIMLAVVALMVTRNN